MDVDKEAGWRLDVRGPAEELVAPPVELKVTILSASRSRGFDGGDLLGVVLTVPWDQVLSDLGINLLGSWLYGLFTRRRSSQPQIEAADDESTTTVNITINGKVSVVGSPTDVAKVLQALASDAE